MKGAVVNEEATTKQALFYAVVTSTAVIKEVEEPDGHRQATKTNGHVF